MGVFFVRRLLAPLASFQRPYRSEALDSTCGIVDVPQRQTIAWQGGGRGSMPFTFPAETFQIALARAARDSRGLIDSRDIGPVIPIFRGGKAQPS